jgi:hypothetical protein
MKMIFLLSTVITIFNLTSSAQIKKGSVLIGGQISYADAKSHYNSTQPDQKNKSAVFNISAGKALKQNKVLGIAISYSHFNYDNNNGNIDYNVNSDRYNFDVFYRQYKKLAKDFYIFGELGGGYFGGNQTDTDIPSNNKTKYTESGVGLFLTPGISYRIYKKLHLELLLPQIAGVNYSVQKRSSLTNIQNNSKQNQFSFNTNLNASLLSNLGLGFRFVL